MNESPDDDAVLLSRAREGDRSALERLLARHAPSVFRYGMRMCRQPEDAAEIAQETLLLATRKLGTFRGDSSLASWLFTIARSTCRRRRRKRSGEPGSFESMPDELAADESSPEELAERSRMRDQVEAALASLSAEHREAILLRDVEGLPVEEVARVLGLALPAAKSRLHRARASLATAVQERLPSPSGSACRDLPRLFSKWLEHEIRPETCARMERHLEGCERCSVACSGLKDVLGACRALPAAPVPATVSRALREAVETLRPAEGIHRESNSTRRASHLPESRRTRKDGDGTKRKRNGGGNGSANGGARERSRSTRRR